MISQRHLFSYVRRAYIVTAVYMDIAKQ